MSGSVLLLAFFHVYNPVPLTSKSDSQVKRASVLVIVGIVTKNVSGYFVSTPVLEQCTQYSLNFFIILNITLQGKNPGASHHISSLDFRVLSNPLEKY